MLARAPLWRRGMDYKHGTGHGVGFYLNVHEGPQAISFRPAATPQPMLAGMVTSNEPGFYADGEFGIRIENVVLCAEVRTAMAPAFGHGGAPYLGFEPLTTVPMCSLLVDEAALESHERRWLDAYHLAVRRAMLPALRAAAEDELALRWMMRETEPLAGSPALAWRRAQWTARAPGGAWLQALPDELDEAFSYSCDDS